MTGIDRLAIAKQFIRMINLVAFDVCSIEDIELSQPADPLSFIIKCRIREPVDGALHKHIRKALKREARSLDMLVGRVGFEREITITVYQKSLRKPAYVHEDKTQKTD